MAAPDRPHKVELPIRRGIEHCLQIEGRAADDFEHIGGGGLLLKAISLRTSFEQAHILDSDHGLVGKGRD